MNLYKISQSVNSDCDTFIEAVVVATDIKQAKNIHPDGVKFFNRVEETTFLYGFQRFRHEWVEPDDVTVEYIGQAADHFTNWGVVCASFSFIAG